MDQPNPQRIAVQLPFARLQRGDDHKNDVENMQDREKSKTDQQETENASHEIVDQHRDLKFKASFPCASISEESPRLISQTTSGPRMCPQAGITHHASAPRS